MAANTKVVNKIKGEAKRVKTSILGGRKPSMKLPLRSLSNVRYNAKLGFLEMKRGRKERTLTVSTVKTFAQTLRMMALSKDLIDTDDIATKREAYYVSKNWDAARFNEQTESDAVMDDVEAMLGQEGRSFHPEEEELRAVSRKSVVARVKIRQGERLDTSKIALMRPGTGIPPRDWESVLGRRAACDIPAGEPLRWDQIL